MLFGIRESLATGRRRGEGTWEAQRARMIEQIFSCNPAGRGVTSPARYSVIVWRILSITTRHELQSARCSRSVWHSADRVSPSTYSFNVLRSSSHRMAGPKTLFVNALTE